MEGIDMMRGTIFRSGMFTLLVVVSTLALRVRSQEPVRSQEKGGTPQKPPYEVVLNWWKPPHGRHQHVSGVFAASPDRIYVTTTTELPASDVKSGVPLAAQGRPRDAHHHFVLVFDANGNVIEEWTQW